NPMLKLAKEAFNIVLSYPVNGELSKHHKLAIESVRMGIIVMPADMQFDSIFYHRLELMEL
ncbi:RepB family plasmid replication initiator protein, partial [Vibrio sp. 10N.261.45.F1]